MSFRESTTSISDGTTVRLLTGAYPAYTLVVRPKIWNNKDAILYKSRPTVAEFAAIDLLPGGWTGAWVRVPKYNSTTDSGLKAFRGIKGGTWTPEDKYGGVTSLKNPSYLPRPLPTEVRSEIIRIYRNAGLDKGCWDVVGWHSGRVQFLECKQLGTSDKLSDEQIRFCLTALSLGYSSDAFTLVEWRRT